MNAEMNHDKRGMPWPDEPLSWAFLPVLEEAGAPPVLGSRILH
jgi:hypothetical protein